MRKRMINHMNQAYFGRFIEDIAGRYGEQSAFCRADGETVSYSQFLQDVRRMCACFSDRHGEKILLTGKNSYELIVCFLSVVCSGNTVVPVDRNASVQELKVICGSCRPDLLLVVRDDETVSQKLHEAAPDTALCSDPEPAAAPYTAENWYQTSKSAAETACIVYTSGSSGVPKGVMLSQAAILCDTEAFSRQAPLNGRTMLCLPLHHMFAWVTAVLSPLEQGSEIIINSDLIMLNRDMNVCAPENICAVPAIVESYYRQLRYAVHSGAFGKELTADLTSGALRLPDREARRARCAEAIKLLGGSLRTIICGGAALEKEIAEFFDLLGIGVFCGYGMTECSPVISVNPPEKNKFGSVGRAIGCNSVKIASPDREGRGEICVKGANLMNGYYGMPDETAKAFQDGWLKTGDKGYIDEDGYIFITGRIKNLIIRSSGENISPEELEISISVIPGVNEVCVREANALLVAEIYAENGSEHERESIIRDVESFNLTLPAFKRIDKVVFRGTPFEKTSTNKIRRM